MDFPTLRNHHPPLRNKGSIQSIKLGLGVTPRWADSPRLASLVEHFEICWILWWHFLLWVCRRRGVSWFVCLIGRRQDWLESPEFGLNNTWRLRWPRGNKRHECCRCCVPKRRSRRWQPMWKGRRSASRWSTTHGATPTRGNIWPFFTKYGFQHFTDFHLVWSNRLQNRALFGHDSLLASELFKDVARNLNHLESCLAGILALMGYGLHRFFQWCFVRWTAKPVPAYSLVLCRLWGLGSFGRWGVIIHACYKTL